MKKLQNIQELQDNFKRQNVHVTGIAEGEREKRAEEKFQETMAKNFAKLRTYTKPQIQKPQRTPSRISTKMSEPRHKLLKAKDKGTLKEGRGKKSPNLQRNKDENYMNFSTETT